jgi:hypothetical protein
MSEKIIMGTGFAILPGAKALISFKQNTDAVKEELVVPRDFSPRAWSVWGDNNLFPQEVLTDLEKNAIAMRALEKRKTVHYGRGIVVYREMSELDANGIPKKQVITMQSDPEIFNFFRINQVNNQWILLVGALEIFANDWVEMILNKAQNKINRVYVKDPAFCRLAKMDTVTGKIPNLYYSAQWQYYPTEEKRIVGKIPMWDPDKWDGKKYPDPNFAYMACYKSYNRSYYNTAVWNGVRNSGWLDIANKVPALKLAIMRNQMIIKYHVTIPDYYFTNKYPSPDYTTEARDAKIKAELQDLNDFLTDVENSGKAFISFAYWSKADKKLMESWKIDVIDNKLDNGSYLPDSMAANSEVLFGIGVDPCLIGAGIPGGKLGAGSGSDKREAFWQLNAEMGIYRQSSLDPLYFIREFNGWDPTIQFDYAVVDTSQTQNQHPTKMNQNIDTTQNS